MLYCHHLWMWQYHCKMVPKPKNGININSNQCDNLKHITKAWNIESSNVSTWAVSAMQAWKTVCPVMLLVTGCHVIVLSFIVIDTVFTQMQNAICPWNLVLKYVKKAVPLQAWSGPEGSRKLRFADFMTVAQDGGKVVSLMHRLPLPPGNTPGTHFSYKLSRPQGHSATRRIMSLKNSSDTIGNQTRDLPVCSVVL
jgi:hypothetical protein